MFAALNTLIHGAIIFFEKKASKTSFLHYAIICFNGRFGWVPYTNRLIVNTGMSKKELTAQLKEFDESKIVSKFLCWDIQLDFYFTDETLISLTKSLITVDVGQYRRNRKKMKLGKSLNGVQIQNFLDFLVVA